MQQSLGCGQGDMTAAIAALVGEQGHVTAVDPAPLDYGTFAFIRLRNFIGHLSNVSSAGAPFTLGQAQDHISKSAIGSRVTFVRSDPVAYLSSTSEKFDAIILAHCVWYFASPKLVMDTFMACRHKGAALLIAEWSLTTNGNSGRSHLLAVLTQAALEAHRSSSDSNVQTVVSAKALQAVAESSGWKMQSSAFLSPDKSLLDGKWEAQAVMSDHFSQLIAQSVTNARQIALLAAMRDATEASIESEGGIDQVTPMQVYVGAFAFEI